MLLDENKSEKYKKNYRGLCYYYKLLQALLKSAMVINNVGHL